MVAGGTSGQVEFPCMGVPKHVVGVAENLSREEGAEGGVVVAAAG